MRTSIPACEAKAILGGVGTFTGRYRSAPPWKSNKVHLEMWDGSHFIWCSVPKKEMETAEFKSRLMGELKPNGDGWLKPWVNHHRALLRMKSRRLWCFVGRHRYETIADGSTCRVEQCWECKKLYAYKMPYWLGRDPKSEGYYFLHETKAEMCEGAFRYLHSWNHVDTPVKEVFGGDLSRPGIAIRFWLGDDFKLRKEEIFTLW